MLITSAASEDRLHLYLNLSCFFMHFFLGPMMGINNSKDLSVKVTPHDESPFQENARRALNFYVSPLKFGTHNDKSLLLLLL
jgi:hypothetical protein